MKKKVVMVCMLMTSICSLYAQNVTLAPEMGISAVQRYGWGQEWRPSAKIGVSVDFNLTNHFGLESGLFYTFRGYSISNEGLIAMKSLHGRKMCHRQDIFYKFQCWLNLDGF